MRPFTFFISYRRQDTAPIALLLKNEIEKRLQFVRVSVDVEEVQVGVHFPDRLRALILEAHATIALIGKQWMPRYDEAASPDTPEPARSGDDWVATELTFSATAPLAQPEDDRYGLAVRRVLPLYSDCERRFD